MEPYDLNIADKVQSAHTLLRLFVLTAIFSPLLFLYVSIFIAF